MPTEELPEVEEERLSRIVTRGSVLVDPRSAVCRYVGPVYRYFMSLVKDPEKADELTEQFVVRFLNKEFQKHLDHDKGMFRKYLKTSIRNMAREFVRQDQIRGKRFRPLADAAIDVAAAEPDDVELDSRFDAACSARWLTLAWKKLEAVGADDNVPYFAVLNLKTNRPELRSQEIAAELNQSLNCDLNAAGVRKILERAREKFADLLLEEVLQSLPVSEHERLEEELAELNLLQYCRSALQRRQSHSGE